MAYGPARGKLERVWWSVRAVSFVILIGSRGLSGVSRVTLGKTGNEVVLKAPAPVVVVK
jgi:hypothetical protein